MCAAPQHRPEHTQEIEIGAFSFLGDPHVAQTLASTGLDWICLDAQHGRFDDAGVGQAVELASGGGAKVVVRVRALDAGLIGRALDAGAEGIVVPMVETPEQAGAAVSATFYPPLGSRSFGPIRAAYGDGTDTGLANKNILCAVMIETRTALENVADIAATPGVGMLFVGPFDLALALGTSVEDLLADASDEGPLRRIARAAETAGVRAGAFAGSPERAARLADLGFTFVAATGDTAALGLGVRAVLDELR